MVVPAGVVLYIGHVLVTGKDRSLFVGPPKKFALALQGESSKAQAYLQTISPALPGQMTKRLMTINPGLTATD